MTEQILRQTGRQGYHHKWLVSEKICSVEDLENDTLPTGIAIACKRSWSFCRKCRWQVSAENAGGRLHHDHV